MTETSPSPRFAPLADDLLLRETNHRCSNDLQLVVSLLALQSRRATSAETRQALTDVMERVAVLAPSRAALHDQARHDLSEALSQVCDALHAQAEPRSILVSLELATDAPGLSPAQVMTFALTVNELATNAIKHAFDIEKGGHIAITVRETEKNIVITVDDDGLPFPEDERKGGLGLGLVKRLVASAGGLFIPPPSGTKVFEIRVPATGV